MFLITFPENKTPPDTFIANITSYPQPPVLVTPFIGHEAADASRQREVFNSFLI